MTYIEIWTKIYELQHEIGVFILVNKQIPNEVILEHNKLLNDYNEAIKKGRA